MHYQYPDVSGTSLMGHVAATYDELVEVFGQPIDFEVDKTYNEWRVQLEGHTVTVYDYHADGRSIEGYKWHVGGFEPIAVDLVEERLAGQRKV